MGRLVIVAVKEPLCLAAVLVKKADAANGRRVEPLFGRRYNFESQRIMTATFTLA
jgi:hypothetical protein